MTYGSKEDTSGVAVAAVPFDVESQKQQPPPGVAVAVGPAPSAVRDEDAGKGMGIAMFVVLVLGFVAVWFLPFISLVCVIVAIVLSSILTCGCCTQFDLRPNVKRFATATLVSLILMLVLQIVYVFAIFVTASSEASNTGTISQSTINEMGTGLVVVAVLGAVLNVMAIVFSALFTWGRNCCGGP